MKRPRGRDLVSRSWLLVGVVFSMAVSTWGVAGTSDILQNCERFLRSSDFAENSILPSVWHAIPAVKELVQREGFDLSEFELQEPLDQKQKVSGPWLEFLPGATSQDQWNIFSVHKYHLVHKNRRELKSTMVFIWYKADGSRDTNLQIHWQWENPRAVTPIRELPLLIYNNSKAKYFLQSNIHWVHVNGGQEKDRLMPYAPGSMGVELKLDLANQIDSAHKLRDPLAKLEVRMTIARKKVYPSHYPSGGLVPTDENCAAFIAQLKNELSLEFLAQNIPLPKNMGDQDPLIVYWRLNWIQLLKLSLIAEELGLWLESVDSK